MTTMSIFDCGSPDTLDLPRRQLVSYGDDDLFAFESDASSDHDEMNNATKNLRITVTIDDAGDKNRKRKRIATVTDEDDSSDDDAHNSFHHEPKKRRISNVPSCSYSAGASTSTSSSNASAKAGTQTTQKQTKPVKSQSTEPYRLIEEIGSGTYGRVYKGQCTETRVVIAVKRLKCKLNTSNTVNALRD